MSHPKLPLPDRQSILETVRTKKLLMRLIAELEAEKRSLPTVRQLCRKYNVHPNTINRIIYGTTNPEDARAA